MDQNKLLAAGLVIAAIIIGALSYNSLLKNLAVSPSPSASPAGEIKSFDDCAAAGYPIMESYPRQCKVPGGATFTENISQGTPTPSASGSPEIISGTKSLLYENKEFGFDLWYPEGSAVKNEGFEGYLNATQNGTDVVGVFLSDSLFKGTNLNEALVAIGVSPDPNAIASCEKNAGEGEQDLGKEDINGVNFHVFGKTGVAAGNLYESTTYRAIHNGSCYEVVDMLHSGNIGNYTPGSVKEFDKAKFSGILKNISDTFSFTQSKSGAIGKVTLSPTCPVQKNPPDPQCAPRPYETMITVAKSGFSKEIKSDSEGKFQVDLEMGTYSFKAKGGTSLPRCSPVSVEIKPQSFSWTDISCDTGIR